jgi:hypothetical protein
MAFKSVQQSGGAVMYTRGWQLTIKIVCRPRFGHCGYPIVGSLNRLCLAVQAATNCFTTSSNSMLLLTTASGLYG